MGSDPRSKLGTGCYPATGGSPCALSRVPVDWQCPLAGFLKEKQKKVDFYVKFDVLFTCAGQTAPIRGHHLFSLNYSLWKTGGLLREGAGPVWEGTASGSGPQGGHEIHSGDKLTGHWAAGASLGPALGMITESSMGQEECRSPWLENGLGGNLWDQ